MILHGGGEHARVVLDCLLAQGKSVSAVFDPKYSGQLFGVPFLQSYDPDFDPQAKAIVSIGDNKVRKKVAAITKHTFGKAIHHSAIISVFAETGEGSMILHGTIIQAQTKIGKHVIVNTGAQVDHDCVIGDFVHLGPGAILCGTVEVGEGSFVGAGAVVIPGKKIGAWVTIGAGAVVRQDLPDFAVAVGNPARIIKYHR
jgi:sugar O-acyltransferase (sialic acid O-acetyltransferase NeuD family)